MLSYIKLKGFKLSIGDIFYIIAIVLFALITFGIVRAYFRAKFDDKGRRLDMLDEYEQK